MRSPRLVVSTADNPVTIRDLVASETRAPHRDRPWLMVNMITSIDGATSVHGSSSGLGGTADREHLVALREHADVILVGASTVRREQERYHLPRVSAAAREQRLARGQAPRPRLAVVSRTLFFGPHSPLIEEAAGVPPEERPIILAPSAVPPAAAAALAPVADIVVAGVRDVDAVLALCALRARGAGIVLCEGGPSLLGQFAQASIIDEWLVTVAPVVVGGTASRMLVAPALHQEGLVLERVLVADGFLLMRYLSEAMAQRRDVGVDRPPATLADP